LQAQLGRGESTYIKEKAAQSIPLWQKYLENVRLEKFNIDEFLKPAKEKGGVAALNLPNIGFAVSGGSVRALLYGTSILDSFDSRNDKANEAKVGGILQLANYAVGVSGYCFIFFT
jgi:lysophospholipase